LFLLGLALFMLVMVGVCMMTLIQPDKNFSWLEPFAPIIVLTGFFIFIIAAGLIIFSLITKYTPQLAVGTKPTNK